MARPIDNAVLGWQARRHAERAFVLINQKKWREARDEAKAAYQLRPNEPQALRAVARLLSRMGQVDALGFWKNLDAVAPLTKQDLREEAGIALQTNDLAAATEAVQRLFKNGKEKPSAADWLLAADIWGRKRDYAKASQFAEKALAEPQSARREQFQAILILETVMRDGGARLVGNPKQIDDRMASIARGNDDVALDALIALAQYALVPPAGANNSSPVPVDELIHRIDNHPLARASHKLLAADVEISQQPDQRAQIEQREIDRWKNSGNEELAALGAWLYHLGEYQQMLDAVPLERAVQARDLFLQHVNALGALGRWDEIRKLLESERYPLDPVVQHMYLARCYAEQGQPVGADNNWQRAIANAAGDLGKLLMVGDYAEKNGDKKFAATAYDAAAAVSPKSRAAQLGRLRMAQSSGDTKRIHGVLKELLKIWPNDTTSQMLEIYLRLLLGASEVETKTAEEHTSAFVQSNPRDLGARMALTLARLKLGKKVEALQAVSELAPGEPLNAPPMAVRAAALAANGYTDKAREEAQKLTAAKLLTEERALIAPLLTEDH